MGEDGSKLKGSKINDDTIEIQAKSSFRNFNKCWVSINDEKQIYLISSTANYDSDKRNNKNILLRKYSKAIRLYYWDTVLNNTQRERKKRGAEQEKNNDMNAL